MTHFQIRSNNNCGPKTAQFLLDDKLTLIKKEVHTQDYDRMIRKSILIALEWLEIHVLSNPANAFKLQKLLKKGIRFTNETNQYLINLCYQWKKIIDTKKIENQQIHIHHGTLDLEDIKYEDINFTKLYMVETAPGIYTPFYPVRHQDHWDYLPYSYISQKINLKDFGINGIYEKNF